MRGVLHLPAREMENAKMMIDGDAEAKKLGGIVRTMLSRDAAARGIDYRVRKIVSGDSTAHGALQLADIIGGAAVEAWKRGVQETRSFAPVLFARHMFVLCLF